MSDSFNYSDDLCEDILKYLPLEDKVKLRAVSTQFNRCLCNVAKKQRVLAAKFKIDLGNKIPYQVSRREFDFRRTESTNVWIKQLIHVLKTFINIDDISIEVIDPISYPEQLLEAIVDNCRQLKSIRFNFKDIDQSVINKFVLKFGNSLRFLCNSGFSYYLEPKLLIRCNQLMALNSFRVDCGLWQNNDISTKKLKKLSKLWIESNCKITSFDLFIRRCPELTHLSASFSEKHKSLNDLISKLSQLKKLKNLSIVLSGKLSKSIASNLKDIALNCNHLKTFAIRFSYERDLIANHFHRHFEHFSTLTEIKLSLESKIISSIELNFLEKCRELTRLELKASAINENTLRGIHRILPHLEHLTLGVSTPLTDQTMESIAKLKSLRQLFIGTNLGDIAFTHFNPLLETTDLGIISVIKSCNLLDCIQIEYRIEITIKTFKELIAKAVKNPNIYFKYELLPKLNRNWDQMIGFSYPPNIMINGKTENDRTGSTSLPLQMLIKKCKFY